MVTQVSHQATAPETDAPVSEGSSDPLTGDAGGAVPLAGATGPESAADALAPLVKALVGDAVPVRFEFWDGSGTGPTDGIGTLRIRSVDAVRRILWAPGELGVARAFVSGDLTVEGYLYALLRVLRAASPRDLRRTGLHALPAALGGARRLGALGPPLPAPPEEGRPTGRIHSPSRDAEVISH